MCSERRFFPATVWKKCLECNEDYDAESFRVKSQGTGPYLSALCRKCASKHPDAKIIELRKSTEMDKER